MDEKYGISFEVEGADAAQDAFTKVAQAEEKSAQSAFSYASAMQSVNNASEEVINSNGDVISSNQKVASSFLNIKLPDFKFTLDVWQAAKDVVSGVGSTLSGLASTAVNAASEFEKVGIQMQATFGKAGGAAALQWASDFGNATSIPLEQVANRLKTIKAYSLDRFGGIDKVMNSLGEAAAATGGNFDGIVRSLGIMATKGGVTFRNISQLMQSGVDVAKLFNDALGISADQLENIDQLGLDGAKVSAALIDQLGKQYTGTMEQVHDSVEGIWFSIQDGFEDALREISTGDAWQGFKDSLRSVRDALDRLWGSESFKKFSADVSVFVVNFENKFMEAIPRIEKAFEALFSAISKVMSIKLPETIDERAFAVAKSFQEKNFPTPFQITDESIASFKSGLDKVKGVLEKSAPVSLVTTLFGDLGKAKVDLNDFTDTALLAKTKAAKEQEKIDKEQEQLRKDLATQEERTQDLIYRRSIDLQKQALSQELKDFQDHQNEIKKEMELRFQADKLYYDFRNEYAMRSFKREQEDAAIAFKRMQEDRFTAFQRGQDDVQKELGALGSGISFSNISDRLKEALKATGTDIQSLVLPGDPFGGRDRIQKFLQDQEKAVRRQQEDEERMLRRTQEDELKRREFIQKQQTFWLEQNTKALIEQATSIKNFKARVDHKLKIIDQNEFVNSFMKQVFKESKIRAKIDGQVIAAP